jgi:[CysO sulfur-carrier protein]-S-L-cysteine hydrolase
VVKLPRVIHDAMVAHALEDRQNEVCGLLAGHGVVVERAFPARNRERSPVRYEIDPADLLRIFRQIDDEDLEHVGIYHSHTHTQAYPSATDIRLAYYPDAVYFIISLMDEHAPQIRAFRILEGVVTEEPMEIED